MLDVIHSSSVACRGALQQLQAPQVRTMVEPTPPIRVKRP